MSEVLSNLLITYFIGFFIALGVFPVFDKSNLGFRTRTIYCSLWFIWITLIGLVFVFALVYAFIKNSTVERSLEKTMNYVLRYLNE